MKDKEWWSYREIRFTRQQVLWILKNGAILREGYWPKEPINTGYVDLPRIRRRGGKGGYFTKPIETIAEIESRLERCGRNGLILLAIEGWDMTVASLSSYFRLPEWVILRGRRQALGFVAGWRRKVR